MKAVLYVLILLCLCNYSFSQGLHFSQYNEQPALLNPALTGVTAPSRASLGYREQWRSITRSYKTMGASYETRFRADNWEQVDSYKTMTFKQRSLSRLAGGLSVYKDNAGDGNLSHTQFNGSLATFVPVSRLSFLSLGIQASLVQRKLDQQQLLFPDQYNGAYYDPQQLSQENFQETRFTYADFASGILWSYGQNSKDILGRKHLKVTAGLSIYHLNKSKQDFILSGKTAKFFKYVAHADVQVSLRNPDYALGPSFMFQQRGASAELVAGTMVKRYLNLNSKYTGLVKRSSIGIGTYYRYHDAVIISLAIQWKDQLSACLSYDLNVSRLRAGSGTRGGSELTLSYTPPKAFLYQKKKGEVSN